MLRVPLGVPRRHGVPVALAVLLPVRLVQVLRPFSSAEAEGVGTSGGSSTRLDPAPGLRSRQRLPRGTVSTSSTGGFRFRALPARVVRGSVTTSVVADDDVVGAFGGTGIDIGEVVTMEVMSDATNVRPSATVALNRFPMAIGVSRLGSGAIPRMGCMGPS